MPGSASAGPHPNREGVLARRRGVLIPVARVLFAGLGLTTACVAYAFSESPYSPDQPEPGSVEAIAAATTEPRFLSPWVAYVPESATVPSPSDYLGHIAGAP